MTISITEIGKLYVCKARAVYKIGREDRLCAHAVSGPQVAASNARRVPPATARTRTSDRTLTPLTINKNTDLLSKNKRTIFKIIGQNHVFKI